MTLSLWVDVNSAASARVARLDPTARWAFVVTTAVAASRHGAGPAIAVTHPSVNPYGAAQPFFVRHV